MQTLETEMDMLNMEDNILNENPGTLAKGLAGAHFGEKDQIALKDKAVE